MPRRKERPLQWTWRVGALQCKHKVKSPVGRTMVCNLGEHLMRCTRRTCEEVGEEKKVIAAGRTEPTEPTQTTGQILAEEANRRFASRRPDEAALDHLVVRKDSVLCTTCGKTEPVHPGDGTPASTFIMALKQLAIIHSGCRQGQNRRK